MKVMKKFTAILMVAGVFFCFSNAKAQGDATILFPDDPIASMLDSLARLNYFESGHTKPHFAKSPNSYFLPIDSVPRPSDEVMAARLAKLDAISPFSLTYNDVVKGYIQMYTLRKRELVSRLMAMSELYFPMFEEILDRYNMPLELKYLAICESALNPNARSRVGATGLWQFMYPTGKMYGLKVNSYVDDRSDPYKSTIAACEYMKFLYDMFQDWEMVLAAYNSGPGTVNKAIRRSGGKKTYWEIRPYLPAETRGYVPAFIAVNYVMNYTAEHNLYSSIPKKTFFETDTVSIKSEITFDQIATILNVPIEDLQLLNPQYKRKVIPYSSVEPYKLCLPAAKVGSFVANESKIYNYVQSDSTMQTLALQEITKIHTVRSGEGISSIARRYNCTVQDIKVWNNLRSLKVRPGQKLTVYIPTNKPTQTNVNQAIAKTNNQTNSTSSGSGENKFHTIQKGDTLYTIAKTYGTTIEQLKKLNNLSGNYVLLPGKKIKVG